MYASYSMDILGTSLALKTVVQLTTGTGRGGGGVATKRDGGGGCIMSGHVKLYPNEKGGGGGGLAMLKGWGGGGWHKMFWSSFYAVA